MRKIYFLLLCLLLAGCINRSARPEYFTNPILAGFYPDPSICKVGDDFYLVTSTFAYYPGIPVFHSKDLVNWKLINHVINKPENFNVEGSRVSRGLFAPSIRYHDGLFYVTCTLVDRGGNFVSTASDPAGPWSDPVWVPEVNGIDPSMYFDDDKAYIVYNSIPPDDKPLYNGHRTIRMYAFDTDSMKVTGEEHLLVNGGVDISKNPVWIEAPHIFKKDGFYYLICAEGGTAYQHSEVVFRSESVMGPYIPYDKNPILTQRHLDPERKNPITTAGHADFVELDNGEWWAVFLACRPYTDKEYFNTGRETFLAPVKWIEGWPVINPDFEEVQYIYPLPLSLSNEATRPYSGNFTFRDEFDSDALAIDWMFLRAPKEKWYNLTDKSGWLSIQARPETCMEKVNASFIGHRQQHLTGSASVSLQFDAQTENEKAGLLIFQNEDHFYYLCKSVDNEKPVVQLYQSVAGDSTMVLMASEEIKQGSETTQLKILSDRDQYSFYYAPPGGEWVSLKSGLDAKFLSTKEAGGFVGCVYAMYATSLGQESTTKAYFDWFEYRGEDDVYKRLGKG